MSLLNEFAENTDIFKPRENRIDQDSFNILIEKYGEDFAKGYLKALHEMNGIIGNIFFTPEINTTITGEEYRGIESQATVYGKLWHLHTALFNFVQENDLKVDMLTKPLKHKTITQSF